VSAYFEEFLLQKAKRAGVHAFLRKETTVEELIDVIELDRSLPFYSNGNQPKIEFFNEEEKNLSKKVYLLDKRFK